MTTMLKKQWRITMDDLFDLAWKNYPKRQGNRGNKKVCRTLFDKAIKKYSQDKVMLAVDNYRAECEESGRIDTPFFRQFHIWLRMGRSRQREVGKLLGIEHYQEKRSSQVKNPKWESLRYFALKNSNGRCCLCGSSAKDGVTLHVDHIKPKSIYPELEFDPENLQVLCESCNIGKSNKDETDWR